MRDPDHAILGGVAGGLGAYAGIDPVIFRLTFVALVFAGGSGFALYVLAWLIVPAATSDADRLAMRACQ